MQPELHLTRDGKPIDNPEPPKKPLHHFTLAECQKGAEEYFQDPVIFKRQGHKFYLIDAGTKTTWGSGGSYGEALVDAFSRMELRKKRARDEHEAKLAKEAEEYAAAHPIKHRVKNTWKRIVSKWQGVR